jgi:hypothetical protein
MTAGLPYYIGIMTIFLVVAKKWSAMDPLHIEDGPSWRSSALSAIYPMVMLALAILFRALQQDHAAAFCASNSFGAAIGGCYDVSFKPARSQAPDWFGRWWIGKLDSKADRLFASVIVVCVGWAITKMTGLDGRFWSGVTLAFVLAVMKSGPASVALSEDIKLSMARSKMLIGGSVLLTMIAGTISLAIWLVLAAPVISPAQSSAMEAARQFVIPGIAFIIGVLLSV